MADIKPSEISSILKQQLDGFKSANEFNEVGTVLTIGDGKSLFLHCTKAVNIP